MNGGAPEKVNGSDETDGLVDNSAEAWLADRIYYGDSGNDMSGYHMTAGDLDQDGFDELIVGSPGQRQTKAISPYFQVQFTH